LFTGLRPNDKQVTAGDRDVQKCRGGTGSMSPLSGDVEDLVLLEDRDLEDRGSGIESGGLTLGGFFA